MTHHHQNTARCIIVVLAAVLLMAAPDATSAQTSHHDSDPFVGVHTRVAGERSTFGAQTCGGGVGGGGGVEEEEPPGVAAHELWGDVIVAGNTHNTKTAMGCCQACQETDGCNVW